MELTGKIIAVLPAQSGVSARTGNPWMSQDYVIEVPGQYPKRCVFKLFGEDRIRQFNIQPNEDLTIQFDIDAHEYNGRWFNEVRGYNVIRQGQQQAAQQPDMFAGQQQSTQAPAANPFPPAQEQNNADDLPF